MSRNKGCSRLTKFLQPPKLVDGIFEVLFRLQKFWWVQKVVRTRNGFTLTDFFAKQTKFCLVQTGSYFRKIQKKSKTVYICEIRFKWPEMIKLSNDGCENHATFQHAILCRVVSFFFPFSSMCSNTITAGRLGEGNCYKIRGDFFIRNRLRNM